jgi:hypothetical protein
MTQYLQIILVSPNAHYPSHNWPNTLVLMRALHQKGLNVRAITFGTTTEPVPPDLNDSVQPVFSRLPPGWRHAGRRPMAGTPLRGVDELLRNGGLPVQSAATGADAFQFGCPSVRK